MGWWRTGHGEDIIGDLPADSLSRLFGKDDDESYQLSYLVGLLARVFEALGNDSSQYLEESGPLTGMLTLKEMPILEIGASVEEHAGGESTSLEVVEEVLTDIARSYDDAMGRNPRLSELLASFVFVQGDYVDNDGNSLTIKVNDLALQSSERS